MRLSTSGIIFIIAGAALIVGAVAVHDGQHRALPAPAAHGEPVGATAERGDLDAAQRAHRQPRLDRDLRLRTPVHRPHDPRLLHRHAGLVHGTPLAGMGIVFPFAPGLLGGFTSFSTFTLTAATTSLPAALSYSVLTITSCLGAWAIGDALRHRRHAA